jgi:hypothetical protein
MAVLLERLARNQVLLREVNERVFEVLDRADLADMTEFLCECSNPECMETVPLWLAEYERVRSKPNQFVLVPDHDVAQTERVVWVCDRFFVVAKTQGSGYAEATDPRSRPGGVGTP